MCDTIEFTLHSVEQSPISLFINRIESVTPTYYGGCEVVTASGAVHKILEDYQSVMDAIHIATIGDEMEEISDNTGDIEDHSEEVNYKRGKRMIPKSNRIQNGLYVCTYNSSDYVISGIDISGRWAVYNSVDYDRDEDDANRKPISTHKSKRSAMLFIKNLH